MDLSFSLDAQFDPSTTREALIESTWNNWLIERCGDVLGEIAYGRMLATPKDAWRFVPVAAEYIGNEGDRWLRGGFAKSFETVRDWLGEHGAILIGGAPVALSDIAYEYAYLSDLLRWPRDRVAVPACLAPRHRGRVGGGLAGGARDRGRCHSPRIGRGTR
ncbi:hypothetical protein ACFSQQ_11670 [Mesorhizobium kowhaii]|uniref:hypothetical protein n=1 Tax=Mesorhizobium kowhaii TaxID=1300272 RepID=UPI00362EC4F2